MTNANKTTEKEALDMHASGRPGKLEVVATKPLTTQRDLSLAYSPGVAAPCKKIEKDPATAYDYTSKGNLVAIISNGTAVLGLGNLGALASKPVMEGKSVLFKRFADIDGIDIELKTENVDDFVKAVSLMEPTFGGINLEDIKAPECFLIEDRLKKMMNIPVFHDDQHGTAIITLAALINALQITKRRIEDVKIVVNGAGAAAIACSELIKSYGAQAKNITMCDTTGVIYKGRQERMNEWKEKQAIATEKRTLSDALDGADVFLGLSVAGALSKTMVKKMAPNPVIFAMANPTPEIMPEDVLKVRDDAIVATGRSDYPNQVNNVLGFPYIFRGALDVRATQINEAMKIAAAEAIAKLAREDVPDEVADAYAGRRLQFGPQYIIPVPFDPRLITRIPMAVAKAAITTGVAQKPYENAKSYENQLASRLDPTFGALQLISDRVIHDPKTIVFAEGEEEKMIRAALDYTNNHYGKAILIGRESIIMENTAKLGLELNANITIHNAALGLHNDAYKDYLYERLQRQGFLQRDVQRLVHQERNIFGACMVHFGHADGLVTGLTRSYKDVLSDIELVINTKKRLPIGLSLCLHHGHNLFIADSSVNENPDASDLVDIAIQAASAARKMGHVPRVALLSYSNFGNPAGKNTKRIQQAVELLRQRDDVDFEFDGDMTVDVALNDELRQLYPFCTLTGPANVLVTPDLSSANISSELLRNMTQGSTIGPILYGLEKSIQIVPQDANVSEIVTMALVAAHDACI